MKKMMHILVLIGFLGALVGCNATQPSKQEMKSMSSVAVVSLAVNNYGFLGTKGIVDPILIKNNVNTMLSQTEEILGKHWTVKPAKSFVNNSAYRKLSIGDVKSNLFSPTVDGAVMPSFTENRKEIIKGVLKPETAKALCKTLGVDAVVLVYSEWMTDTGKFVPTVKALTKNCFAMYGKDGRKLFYDRKDVRGTKVLGGPFAGVHINEETIDQWVTAYANGAEYIMKRHM